MTRPLYENAETLQGETRVAQAIRQSWGCDLRKLPIAYRVDFAGVKPDNSVQAWIEVKCRDRGYPEMILSLSKYQAGVALAHITGRPFLMVYSLPSGIFYASLGTCGTKMLRFCIAGRTDRNDSQDVEPCVMIPASMLKPL